VNNIIVGENIYVATIGKGLKERSIEGRFCYIRVVLLVKNKDKGRQRMSIAS
jgi:hypothetical protein